MSEQVSRGSAGEYQEDEQAGVARLRWRVLQGEGSGGAALPLSPLQLGSEWPLCKLNIPASPLLTLLLLVQGCSVRPWLRSAVSDLAFSCDICVRRVEEAMEASLLSLGGDVFKAAGGRPCSGPSL